MNLNHVIQAACLMGLKVAFPSHAAEISLEDIQITEATQPEFGHYQCNSAMRLTKTLGIPPRELALKWVETLKDALKGAPLPKGPTLFEKIEVAGPGFINFSLNPQFLSALLESQLQDPYLGVPRQKKPLKVVIDYSSPNIAKEMHVGHLRTTIIGDCIARILRFKGYEVLPLNHLGDWGTQFGMLIAYLKEVLPEITGLNPPHVKLSTLVDWYRKSKKRFDEDEAFSQTAKQEVVALQSGEPEARRAWEHICAISRQGFQEIYDLLDIHLIERGESFYNPFLAPLIQDLEQKKLLVVSDGAKCLFVPGFINREGEALPIILQKSDGAYNYSTTDLAAIRHKVLEEKADWLIYVTDAGQSQHFQMIFAAARMAGYYDPKKMRVDHVPYGVVLRADGKKFKTREGDTERLIDLIQVAIDKAKQLLHTRHPEIAERELAADAQILGVDAIKYADLSCHRVTDYIFSYDKMLQFEGNTAAFLLYAYVRIQSIKRKVGLDVEMLIKQHTAIVLEEPAEIALGLLACRFPEVIDQTLEEILPNRLTDYLYRLAERFHVFFHHCRVEGVLQQNSRLLLCEIVGRILHQGLSLLGLKLLEKM